MLERMLRALKLDAQLYEEVEADPRFNGEALLIVVIASLLSGLGMALAYPQDANLTALVANVLSGLLLWAAWAAITLWIGKSITRGPETRADLGEMLRTLAYAHVPQFLVFFVFIPVGGPLLALAAGIWKMVMGIVAIRQALDFTTSRAIMTGFLGFLVVTVFTFVIRLIF
jgi:hypothetical protein